MDKLTSNIKHLKKSILKLKLKRLPFARVITLTEINKDEFLTSTHLTNELIKEKFGIKLKSNTTKIEKIDENGLFFKCGLKYDPNKVEFDIESANSNSKTKLYSRDRLSKWAITEINGDYVSYYCSAEEVI